MAKQYVVTEEEFMSLIESLELVKLKKEAGIRENPAAPATWDEIHRSFHYVAVRWVQKMGFGGHRGA